MENLRLLALVLALLLIVLGSNLPAENPGASNEGYDVRLEKGVELYSQSKYIEAEVFFKNLTKSSPDRKEAYLWLGHALQKQGKQPQAREAFHHYSEMAPNDVEGLIEMAHTYEVEDNKPMAKLWYKKAQDADPKDEHVRQALRHLESVDAIGSPQEGAATSEDGAARSDAGFWRVGLAGVTGARTVWWGRAILLLIIVTGTISGWTNITRARERFPLIPIAVILITAGLTAVLWYVIFWGVPTGSNWLWLAAFVIINVIGANGALSMGPQPSRL